MPSPLMPYGLYSFLSSRHHHASFGKDKRHSFLQGHEPMAKENIVARTLLHACHVSNIGNGDDAVVVSEIVEDDQGNIEPRLRKIVSPKVSVWVTQKQYQNHWDKKEFEAINRLDEFTVPNAEKDREIFRVLKGYAPNHMSPKMRRELYQSPYLYGANIMIEARVAMMYKKNLLKANRTPHSPTTGFFDIEKSLLKSSYGRLPLMVFTYENQVFLAMKKSFMNEIRNGQRVNVTMEEVERGAHELIDPLVNSIFEDNDNLKDYRDRLPFKYHFYVGETEVDMIKWIFGKMHETKVSFIGIWNLGFDIPEIIKILEENDIPLEDVFAHPSLRNTGFAHASYRADPRQVQHFTQKWHWLTATAHFQFVDSMALYSYIRIVDGKEASYALDDILKKFNLGGKLKIGQTPELEALQTEDWHREMLSKHFLNYALYAMWDGIALQLLEWNNNDLTAMMLLGGVTPPKYFVNQTIRVTNTLFEEWLAKGQVLGTGVDIEGVSDDELLNAGGAVLQPEGLTGRGMKLFAEWPEHRTNCFAWLNDLDFSAQYPTNILALNISKQTKLGTIVSIKAPWVNSRYTPYRAIEVFCSYLITPYANGVEMGVEFFNLPDYGEMNDLFQERLNQTMIAA